MRSATRGRQRVVVSRWLPPDLASVLHLLAGVFALAETAPAALEGLVRGQNFDRQGHRLAAHDVFAEKLPHRDRYPGLRYMEALAAILQGLCRRSVDDLAARTVFPGAHDAAAPPDLQPPARLLPDGAYFRASRSRLRPGRIRDLGSVSARGLELIRSGP